MNLNENPTTAEQVVQPTESPTETCPTCGEHTTAGQCNDTARGIHPTNPDEE